MATTHKVYETTSTYKGRELKMRHTLTDVDEDYTDEDALKRLERSALPEGATNNSIKNITAQDPVGPLAKVEQPDARPTTPDTGGKRRAEPNQ